MEAVVILICDCGSHRGVWVPTSSSSSSPPPGSHQLYVLCSAAQSNPLPRGLRSPAHAQSAPPNADLPVHPSWTFAIVSIPDLDPRWKSPTPFRTAGRCGRSRFRSRNQGALEEWGPGGAGRVNTSCYRGRLRLPCHCRPGSHSLLRTTFRCAAKFGPACNRSDATRSRQQPRRNMPDLPSTGTTSHNFEAGRLWTRRRHGIRTNTKSQVQLPTSQSG